LVLGLLLDGWAHNNQAPETVLTPWHAVFYSGFAVVAALTLSLARRRQVQDQWFDHVPVGLGLALVGLGVFAAGAIGDMAWHTAFGIEVGLSGLLSPTHLLLFCGALLILAGPFRAAWADAEAWAPSWPRFWPPLLSIALVTVVVAFFFLYLTPFFRQDAYGATGAIHGTVSDAGEQVQVVGVAAVLVTTLIYMAPLLLILRRWRPPGGTATFLFSFVTLGLGGLDSWTRWPLLVAAPVGGAVADLLICKLSPSFERPGALRVTAAAVPVGMWSSYFALFHLTDGLGWPPELWAGVTAMSALTGVALSFLVVPPPIPERNFRAA